MNSGNMSAMKEVEEADKKWLCMLFVIPYEAKYQGKMCIRDSSYCLKYADDSTDENPVVLAKGVDENGKEFEQRIYINDVNPSSATVVEMRALEAHYKVEKQGGFTSLPLEAGNMGLNDRRDFISMFKKSIEDLNKLGRFDLSLLWTKSMDAYLDLTSANSKYK